MHTDLNEEHNGVNTTPREKRDGFNNNIVIATGCNMAPYEEFTPIYIIKNLVVKPVRYADIHLPFAYLGGALFRFVGSVSAHRQACEVVSRASGNNSGYSLPTLVTRLSSSSVSF